jgi:O-antigen/teichoic acid export membrane protein
MTAVSAPSFSSRLAAVLAGEIVNKGSVVLAFVYLAHTLDPAVYGEVEWALSILMVATLAADAGLSTWANAQIAAKPDEAGIVIARVGWLRLALAVPAYLGLAIVARSYGGRAGSALLVYGLALFLTPLFLHYVFNGLLQTKWAALGNALRGLTFAAMVLLIVDAGSSPSAVAIAEVTGAAALALCNLIVLRGAFQVAMPARTTGSDLKAVLAKSWRIGATEVTWAAHWYAGLILLGYLAGPTDVAWHSVGLRIVMALHTGVWLYLYVLLPNLTRLIRDDAAGWSRLVEESLALTGWLGWGVALVGTLAAEPLLIQVFGEPYVAAAPVLRAMIWVVPIAWMSGHIRYSLIAAQRPDLDYHAGLIGAGTTIAVTLALAPALQSAGGGVALLVGTIANAVAAWILARGVLPTLAAGRNVAPSSLCGAACVLVGLGLGRVVGDVAATLVAGVAFAACAVVAERRRARQFVYAFVGGSRPS